MKILIVSYWFPPQNVIGAVRVGKLAKFLHARGHEVRVLTSAPTEPDLSLSLEIPEKHVVHAGERRIGAFLDTVLGALRRARGVAAPGAGRSSDVAGQVTESSSRYRSLRQLLTRQYYAVLHTPDKRVGWLKTAVKAGQRLLAGWRPDVILASSPPMTALLVAHRLSKEFTIPWVADLRDLWTDNPYYSHPAWRKRLDEIIERRVFRTAAMLISVTPPWTETVRRKFGRPAHLVLNGFVEEDFPADLAVARDPAAPLTIVYTGNIYRGYRDPSPLFAAIALLGERRNRVSVHFYGPSDEDIRDLAAQHGVTDRVVVENRVAYRESLIVQMRADILLLLQWNNPADEGNIPAKFFEYIGAGRPILFHGYEAGTLAQMIRDRQAGFVSNDPAAIARQLERWIEQHEKGGVPALTAAAKGGLGRDEQFRQLEQLLFETVA